MSGGAGAGISARITSKRFGDVETLGPISLDVAPGETVAVLGPSGIGKSTLTRILAGLDTAFEGAASRPARMAAVFQEPVLLPWRSALANITLAAGVDDAAALAALGDVGLSDKAGLFPGQLSLGQQRRLSLARAFAAAPDALFMDEPFASLDEATAAEMAALARALIARRPIATLLVTHAPEEAASLADRAIVLAGTPARIAAETGPGAGADAIRAAARGLRDA